MFEVCVLRTLLDIEDNSPKKETKANVLVDNDDSVSKTTRPQGRCVSFFI